MSFLRNFRNNLIQHQSNKVYYKEGRGRAEESDEGSRYDTYTRKNRNSKSYDDDLNGKASGNYSTLRTENVVRVYLNSPGSPTIEKQRLNDEDDQGRIARSDTFTKHDKPTIARSDTFTMKSEAKEKSGDDEGIYNTYTRSNKGMKITRYFLN